MNAYELELGPRDRLVFVGKTGTGKSYAIKALCERLMDDGARLVVWDVCDEYSVHGRPSKETDLGPLHGRCTPAELARMPRRLDQQDLALAIVPSGEPQEVARQFRRCAELIRDTGNVVFVVEEVGYFGRHAYGKLEEIATLYRKDGVAAVFCAQRAIQIPKTARSQASQIFAFAQDEEDDLVALEKRCGRSVPDIAERLPRLGVGECIHWRDSLSTTHKEKPKCPPQR